MAPETSKIVTISERKSREAARRAEAARAVIERLRGFVRETGNRGRFIVFGSVANAGIRYSSDLDVLIDFPADLELSAWRAVEDACGKANIPADIKSVATSTAEFVEKILARPTLVIA